MRTTSQDSQQEAARDRARLKVMVGAAGIFGLLPLSLSPLLVTAAQQSMGFSALNAGLLATCALLGVSVAAVLVGAMIRRISLRMVYLCGILIVAATQGVLLAADVRSLGWLCGLWFLSGTGSGCGVVVGDVLLSRTRRPAVFAGLAMAITSMLMLCVFPLGTLLAAQLGIAAMSWISLTVTILVFTALQRTRWTMLLSSPRMEIARNGTVLDASALVLISGVLFLWTRDGMVWSFSAALATSVGVDATNVGITLGLAGVCGVLGSAAASWVSRGNEFNRAAAIYGVVLSGIVAGIWAMSSEAFQFIALQLTYNALQLFTYPLMLGLAAQLDRSGRLAALSGGVTLLGAALGPVVSGALVESWGGTGLTGGVGALGLLSALALVFATRERRQLLKNATH